VCVRACVDGCVGVGVRKGWGMCMGGVGLGVGDVKYMTAFRV
jgi:hypothetical protein